MDSTSDNGEANANKVSEESDKFFVVIECCEHNQSENMDF